MVLLFSPVFPQQHAFSSSGFSSSSSAAPSVVWASRRLAVFGGYTCPHLKRLWCWKGFVQCPLQISWRVRVLGAHAQTACIQLNQVFSALFFLGFASVGCSALLLLIEVNSVYGWLSHVHRESCSRVVCIISMCLLNRPIPLPSLPCTEVP